MREEKNLINIQSKFALLALGQLNKLFLIKEFFHQGFTFFALL